MKNMLKFVFVTIVLNFSAQTAFSQIKVDSIFLYYGMTQTDTETPLMDFIENLETGGAKLIKIKTKEFDIIKSSFASCKPKKYKGEKHKGTVYFAVIFTGGKKEFAAFESTLQTGKFINLSSKEQYKIDELKDIDALYYALLQLH